MNIANTPPVRGRQHSLIKEATASAVSMCAPVGLDELRRRRSAAASNGLACTVVALDRVINERLRWLDQKANAQPATNLEERIK